MSAKVVARWSERLIGLMISFVYLAFIIGEGLDGLYENTDPLVYLFFSMMALSLIGYAASWYWEELGGVLMILGGTLMLAFHLFRQDLIIAMVYGLPFILVGLLSIALVPDNKTNFKTTKKHPDV